MKWIKASDLKDYVVGKKYFAKWESGTGIRSVGVFNGHGDFVWCEQGYIPVSNRELNQLTILDESTPSNPSPVTAEDVVTPELFYWASGLTEYPNEGQTVLCQFKNFKFGEITYKESENEQFINTVQCWLKAFASSVQQTGYGEADVRKLLKAQVEECRVHFDRCARDKGMSSKETDEWITSTPVLSLTK